MKSLLVVSITLLLILAGCTKKSEPAEVKFETASIKVESAQCGTCATTITDALKGVEGVEKADVDIKAKTASVTFFPVNTNLAQLEEAISKAGYSANDKKADPEAYEKLDACCKVTK